MINKNKFYNKLEKSIFRIYESLLTEVSEASNQSSIDDIEIKLDVIMDALGLKKEKEDKDEAEITDINIETTLPKETEDNTMDVEEDKISFVDENEEDEDNN